MDVIDRVLHFAETGEVLGDSSIRDPVKIFEAVQTLRDKSPKDFLMWWTNAKEYQRAKLIRSTALPETDGNEKEMLIKMVDSKEDLEQIDDITIKLDGDKDWANI